MTIQSSLRFPLGSMQLSIVCQTKLALDLDRTVEQQKTLRVREYHQVHVHVELQYHRIAEFWIAYTEWQLGQSLTSQCIITLVTIATQTLYIHWGHQLQQAVYNKFQSLEEVDYSSSCMNTWIRELTPTKFLQQSVLVVTGDSVNFPECVIMVIYMYACCHVHEPLRWVGRVPMGQKSFSTYHPQFSRLGTLVALPFAGIRLA